MPIDIRSVIEACILPIVALIILEIFWNLVGYYVAPLMWLLKLMILAWAGCRYYMRAQSGGIT